MASLHTYAFDNLSRIGDDVCAYLRRWQNNSFGAYTTKNYFDRHYGMSQLHSQQVNKSILQWWTGHVGAGGCNVDSDSNLKIGTIQTN